MITTPNVTSADPFPGAETNVRGEAYAQAVLDDEGSPALPLEDRPMSLRERAQEAFDMLTREVRSRPLVVMGVALGLGYIVGRIRARS
jgi:hypothetical protein